MLVSKKVKLSEIAILFRVSAHTRSFEERLISIGLPYKIIGGLRFYERKEIKDIIAYLRLINNLSDDLAFERVINTPKRGIGETSVKKIRDHSKKVTKNPLKSLLKGPYCLFNMFLFKKRVYRGPLPSNRYAQKLIVVIFLFGFFFRV